MIKICLSHDIDRTSKTHQYFTKSVFSLLKLDFKGIKRQFLSLKESNPYWLFKDFIEIEERFSVRSTVFFLNESIKVDFFKPSTYKLAMGRYKINEKRIKDVIKFLDKNGWEIGVHGSFNSFKNKDLLAYEKKVLEEITGRNIIGIRQHYLNLNEITWSIQKTVGFKYDSSWGYTDNIGFKDERYKPFAPFNDEFKVIPLIIMDTCFMKSEDKWIKYENLLDQCEEKNAVMVINFHQHVFSKHDFPGYKEAYIELIERAKNRGAEFFTLSQIYNML